MPAAEKEGKAKRPIAIKRSKNAIVSGLEKTEMLYYPTLKTRSIFTFEWSKKEMVAPERLEITDWQDGLEINLLYESQTITCDAFEPTKIALNKCETQDGEPLVQIGLYDFDGDGIEELIFAYRINWHIVGIDVYKYYPPHTHEHIRPANWEKVGSMAGPGPSDVSGQSIFFHEGYDSPDIEHIWFRGNFVDVNSITK